MGGAALARGRTPTGPRRLSIWGGKEGARPRRTALHLRKSLKVAAPDSAG